MRIIDINNNEISSPDLSFGKLVEEKIFIKHHPAVDAIREQSHYEVVATYPNGGKDVELIIDVPGVEGQEAWDEYEDILRYIPYTDDELTEMNSHRTPSLEDQIAELKEMMLTLQSSVQAIMAANGISLEQEIVYEE